MRVERGLDALALLCGAAEAAVDRAVGELPDAQESPVDLLGEPRLDAVGVEALVVHDAHIADPSYAFGLSRLTDSGVLHRAPIGIFRSVEAPAYDDLTREQVALASSGRSNDDAALQDLVNGGDTWLVDDTED